MTNTSHLLATVLYSHISNGGSECGLFRPNFLSQYSFKVCCTWMLNISFGKPWETFNDTENNKHGGKLMFSLSRLYLNKGSTNLALSGSEYNYDTIVQQKSGWNMNETFFLLVYFEGNNCILSVSCLF